MPKSRCIFIQKFKTITEFNVLLFMQEKKQQHNWARNTVSIKSKLVLQCNISCIDKWHKFAADDLWSSTKDLFFPLQRPCFLYCWILLIGSNSFRHSAFSKYCIRETKICKKKFKVDDIITLCIIVILDLHISKWTTIRKVSIDLLQSDVS